MLVVVGVDVDCLAELAHALAERARHFGEALGTEHQQRDGAEEQQVDGTVDSHNKSG